MDALQLQKTRKKGYSGPTSVRVPLDTRKFLLENGMTLAGLITVAPGWRIEYFRCLKEIDEMRENMSAAQKKLTKLYEENDELRRFKERTMARIKSEGLK